MQIRNSLFRLSLLGVATLTSAMVSVPIGAHAAYVCPNGPGAGERQVGTTGGSGGSASVRVCESTGGSSGSTPTAPQQPTVDPETARMEAQISRSLGLAMDAARAIKETAQAKAEFFRKYGDPLFAGDQGMWLLLGKGDGTGKDCAATFLSSADSTTVSFFGPNKILPGAILFQGPAVPLINRTKEVRVILSTNDAAPATVRAFQVPIANRSAILLPTDMITTMRGTTEATWMTLQLDGKEVFRTNMAGIMVTRDAMLKCMHASS
jgi:hypothetical protein